MSAGRIAILAASASAVAVAAGCGSSSSSTTSTQATSAQQWAHGLCSAVSTYVGTLRSAAAGLKTNPSSAGLDTARNNIKDATSTFTSAVSALGRPQTSTGQQAAATVNQLSTSLQGNVETIKNALSAVDGASGVMNAVSVVSGALVSAKDEIHAAGQKLQALPHGELKDAFASTSSCSALTA